jgi:hypothetical protein
MIVADHLAGLIIATAQRVAGQQELQVRKAVWQAPHASRPDK